jgi:outer membrane lipopolysaccharide assembly protein LptE/RlpB
MKKILFLISLLLITSSCGFKVVNKAQQQNFHIIEVTTTGDKKINYKIKNNLIFNSKADKKKQIKVSLYSKKIKSIKEKNIKNEIKKYQIIINIDIEIVELNNLKTYKFNVSAIGEFDVFKQHSQTLNNEKKLVELLTDNISEKILRSIGNKLNAL